MKAVERKSANLSDTHGQIWGKIKTGVHWVIFAVLKFQVSNDGFDMGLVDNCMEPPHDIC